MNSIFGGSVSNDTGAIQIGAALMTSQATQAASILPGQTLTPNMQLGVYVFTPLDADLTVVAPTNYPQAGLVASFTFQQDSVGGHKVTFAGSYGASRFIARRGPNTISTVYLISNGDGSFYLSKIDGIDTSSPINVVDWGCDPAQDGVVDGTLVQEILDLGLSPYIPPNTTIEVNQPLWMKTNNQGITGGDRHTSIIRTVGGFAGGAIVMTSTFVNGGLPTVTGITSSGGKSGHFIGGQSYYLALSQNPLISLNGLAAFTVDFFLRVNSTTGGADGHCISCQGFKSFSTTTKAFDIATQVSDSTHVTLAGTITTGGSQTAFNSGTTKLTVGTTYHIAVTYDGAHVRLFINGGQAGSSFSATGTATQAPYENWVIAGVSSDNTAGGGLFAAGPIGDMDSIRISNVARWTTNFTPPASKANWDSNTIFLHNFDNEQGQFSVAKAIAAPGGTDPKPQWLLLRRLDELTFVSGQYLSNFSVVEQTPGCGIFMQWATESNLSDLYLNCNLTLINNSYNFNFNNLRITASQYGNVCLQMGAACGAGFITSAHLVGGVYQFNSYSGVGEILGMDLVPTSASHIGLLITGDSNSNSDTVVDVNAINIDDESAGSNWECGALFSNMVHVNVVGGNWDLTSRTAPPIKVDNCRTLSITGTSFATINSSQPVVGIISAGVNPIQVRGCFKYKGAVSALWSAQTGTVLDHDAPAIPVTSASYNLDQPVLHYCDATSGAITLNLPAANAWPAGTTYTAKKTDSGGNAVTLTAGGSDKIDGSSTYALSAQYKYVSVKTDGSANWFVVANN